MIKECRHIKTNGIKCQSPAMRGSCFCYFHGRTRIYVAPPPKRQKFEMPPLAEPTDLLAALNQIIQAIASGQVDNTRASKLLHAIQLARQTFDAPISLPPAQQPPPTGALSS
jgi:hypothetical protein